VAEAARRRRLASGARALSFNRNAGASDMQQHSYQDLLETSQQVNWRIDDIIGRDERLDFSKPFLPETFARTEELVFLSPEERLALNHIRSRGYLAMFELVEQFIVPFISEQAVQGPGDDPYRGKALRHFAREETKHRELFRRFLAEFDDGFGIECGLIGPASEIADAVLAHGPMAVTIAVLGLEWMSQDHYLGSVRDDGKLDPQFKSLLKHHWMEEAQHAALDGLMLQTMARAATADEIDGAIDEYFEIGGLFDGGFKAQAGLDLAAFERATGRTLGEVEREAFLRRQHQALRWTFLGSAMRNPNFQAALGGSAKARVEAAANAFC
jgi:hypothetical protein